MGGPANDLLNVAITVAYRLISSWSFHYFVSDAADDATRLLLSVLKSTHKQLLKKYVLRMVCWSIGCVPMNILAPAEKILITRSSCRESIPLSTFRVLIPKTILLFPGVDQRNRQPSSYTKIWEKTKREAAIHNNNNNNNTQLISIQLQRHLSDLRTPKQKKLQSHVEEDAYCEPDFFPSTQSRKFRIDFNKKEEQRQTDLVCNDDRVPGKRLKQIRI